MRVSIRKFTTKDIENKIRWINNESNNQFLHYDLPLEYDKTLIWYEHVKDRIDRYDAVIEADGIPVGLIGLLSIDNKNRKAEYYVSMGEVEYKGKGIAAEATHQLLEYAFCNLRLERVYLYTESENHAAQKMFKRVGFREEGLLKKDIISRGRYVDRSIFGITRTEYFSTAYIAPIMCLGDLNGNNLYIKREDLLPYSFGGNKARKGLLFFREIDKNGYDCVVTYGSSHSNHCRIISNMAAERNMPCYIIAPEEASEHTYNSQLMELFNAKIEVVPTEQVHDRIELRMKQLQDAGKKPYFIPGGGHGNIGTQAYVNCYDEIIAFQQNSHVHFDFVFLASGTGTTHAGLVCGQLLSEENGSIVGISIAREKERGRNVVVDSIHDYLKAKNVKVSENLIQEKTIFLDDYIGNGYAHTNPSIKQTILNVLTQYGIPLDGTYTGKAFYGMQEYIKRENINGKNILFIHTGGTPLFFDELAEMDAR